MKKFAVFDIDGTLIRWQLYHAVVDRLAKRNILDSEQYAKVREARMVWKKRAHPEAFKKYEQLIIKAYESALPTMTVQTFNEIVEETAEEYKEQVYSYTRQLAADLKKKGYMLLAISGSHQELVEHVGKQFGFDHCVGTQYLRDDDRFTGEKIVASADKASALKDLIKNYGLSTKGSYAVGDSLSDVPMLELVERPLAFNPDRQLYEIAKKNGWQIVVERKNVVYDLQEDAGSYRLQ